jgi:exodeoxyribonuclease X
VHHISDEDVAKAKSWDAVCSTFFDRENFSDIVAFAAHNAAFDQQWLPPDLLGNLPLICTYKAALHIWPDAPRHTNQVLRYWLNLDMDRSLADRAHRAMPDAYVTAHLLREILKHATMEELIRWTNQPALLPKVTFGKYRGQTWTDVPPDYLQWILRQQDMNEDVVHTARHYLAIT